MYSGRFLRRLTAGAAVIAVAGAAAVVTSAAANAQQGGTLTLKPATGSNLTHFSVRTSAPCPSTSKFYNIQVDGQGPAANFDGTLTGTTEAGFSSTAPFEVRTALSFENLSSILGLPIVPAPYDIILRCRTTLKPELARFTVQVNFTSPTAYSTTDSKGSPPTSTSGTTTTTAPSATPDSATTNTAGSPAETQPIASTGTQANFGGTIGYIFVGVLVLLAAGVALIISLKRRAKRR